MPQLRRTFAVREVLRVGMTVDGQPYLSGVVGGGKSLAICLADSTVSGFEDELCNRLALNKGDRVEFFLSCRKLGAKR